MIPLGGRADPERMAEELFSEMTDGQRIALLLSVCGEYSATEISEMAGCTEEAARTGLRVGLAHLRRFTREKEEELGLERGTLEPEELLRYIVRAEEAEREK